MYNHHPPCKLVYPFRQIGGRAVSMERKVQVLERAGSQALGGVGGMVRAIEDG